MTLEEKERKILNLILEYTKTYAPNNEGCFGILLKDFLEKGLDRTEIRLSLTRLKGGDIIKELYHCWGFTEKEEGEKKFHFTVTDRDAPIYSDDLEGENEEEAYCVTIDERNLDAALKGKSIKKKDEIIMLYLSNEGDLYRESKQEYCYPMMEEKERQKLLRYFIELTKISQKFRKIKDVAIDFEKSVQSAPSIRTEIGKINAKALERLKIGHKVKMPDGRSKIEDGLIEGKQNSGYRLNLKIKIILRNK